MAYDRDLLVEKLMHWDRFVTEYRLPEWESIPDFGLYMDQVIVLLQQYLNFIPPANGGKESFVTASAINNYVRLKVMPAPVKRKYSRVHIAYIIMILTLKLSLSISDIQQLLPAKMTDAQMRDVYKEYVRRFYRITQAFAQKIRGVSEVLQSPETDIDGEVSGLINESALNAGFYALLAEKLISLSTPKPSEEKES